jgi:hydroxyacylglutathione hydrolase
MKREQYVCLVCGFNIIGFHPDRCPFCGAGKERFITVEECSARYKVVATPVSEKVMRLNSHPPLGIEHAAYRIETRTGASTDTIWSATISISPIRRKKSL